MSLSRLTESRASREERDLLRVQELRRCQRSIWYLLMEYLNRSFNPYLGERNKPPMGLTERLHRPVCEWIQRRIDGGVSKIQLVCKRGWHKSTIFEAIVLQQLLRDPLSTNLYLTNSDDLCNDIASSIGDHLMHNMRLRELDPVGETLPRKGEKAKPFPLFPHPAAKKFLTLTPGNVAISLRRPYGAQSRGKSVRFRTWKSEGGGKHVNGLCILDDPIGRNEVERSEIQKVTRWMQNTVYQIVDSHRWIMAATFWPGKTVVHDWMRDPDVWSIVLPGAVSESDAEIRALLERDEQKVLLAPDYKFTNPTFWLGAACPEGPLVAKAGLEAARRHLREKQRTEIGEFPEQVMCDPEPKADKPWSSECEHFTAVQPGPTSPGALGTGTVFVLSDPAPYLQGGYKGLGEKARSDGSKDWWSIAVWKLRPRGDLLERILLDGVHSQEWGHKEGASEAARLMKKWRTNLFISENPDEHFQHMIEACFREGVHLRRTRLNGPLKFSSYNAGDRKNRDFIAFAEAARQQLVWICTETVPKEFLHGDGDRTGFLTQARSWRKTAQGKNSLRFDDDADVCARVMDAALSEFAPTPEALRRREMDDIWTKRDEPAAGRSRYCGL